MVKKLPRRYMITGNAHSKKEWWQCFALLLECSDSFIQFRPASQDMKNPASWAKKARRLAREADRMVLLNGTPEIAELLDMDGVHLSSRVLMGLSKRPLPSGRLVGASCHSKRELMHAEQVGVDFVCLSPVFDTPSHPGARALGMEKFETLASECKIPVFALGGIQQPDLDRVRLAGGYGISGISAFWPGTA